MRSIDPLYFSRVNREKEIDVMEYIVSLRKRKEKRSNGFGLTNGGKAQKSEKVYMLRLDHVLYNTVRWIIFLSVILDT